VRRHAIQRDMVLANPSIRLSVCLSNAGTVRVYTNEHIVTLLTFW